MKRFPVGAPIVLAWALSGSFAAFAADKPAPERPPAVDPKAAAKGVPVSRYEAALDRFGRLLETYVPDGKPLYVRTPDALEAARLSDAPADAKRPAEMMALVRDATNRIGGHVIYVSDTASNTVALDDPAARRGARNPDVLIAVTVTDPDEAKPAPPNEKRSQSASKSVSDLWLHLNLVDFANQIMIPKMQASGVLLVQRDTGDRNYDFSMRGTTYALTGNTRDFESAQTPFGLLATLSVVELLGRYTLVPYWRCIPGGRPDPVVLQELETRFRALDNPARVRWLRETLSKYGFDLPPERGLDNATKLAVDELIARFNFRRPADYLDAGLFLDLYQNVPLTPATVPQKGRNNAT